MELEEFIKNKTKEYLSVGFEVLDDDLNKSLFPFQKYIIKKALKAGKYAIFADCGLGKTLMQLEWAMQVFRYTDKPVLILAPLAVGAQTILEGEKFGIKVVKASNEFDNPHYGAIQISNYEQIENINCSIYSGIVLDESSILKNYTGAYKQLIIQNFEYTPFKLACTATPSPNDELELGNHAEFLNVMTYQDMRAKYFTTDKELIKADKYRLKKHAVRDFYGWVSTWACMISKPSDLGFEDGNYILPILSFCEKKVITDKKDNGKLFNDIAISATEFNSELKLTKVKRLSEVIEIVKNSTENFIIWIKQNEEGEYLKEHLLEAIEVSGSDSIEYKESKLLGFSRGEFRILITKAKIAQYGLNFQICRNQIFASLDFSFESLYQSIRRSYRFGQKQEVNIYLITTDTMENVIKSIEEKQEKFIQMQTEMREQIIQSINIDHYDREIYEVGNNIAVLNDCVDEARRIPDNSMDYSFFSPPFGALYVFSNDPRDMSNVKNNDEFLQHFRYLVIELERIIKKGRLVSIHMMQSTTLLGRDGYYSIVDFRGDLIRLFQECGFIFHAENMIRKDPKTAAIRTKNRQLMHGTTKTDSSIVRPGLADYILTFKKRGENEVPIKNNIPFDLWCKIAEPIWMEIEEGDTLDYRGGRDEKDERHITPTQKKAIEWSSMMWCNKGETMFCPFGGIGTEGVVATEMGIKYYGVELKKSYFELLKINLNNAVEAQKQLSLFK